jgi:uncharacterized membrane protein
LRTRGAKTTAAALAAGEVVVDKLARTPNRTDPPSLVLRAALGAGAAGLLARSEEEPPGPAATVGGIAAVVAAFVGFLARRRLSRSFPPLVVALGEDALAAALATAAVTVLAGSGSR